MITCYNSGKTGEQPLMPPPARHIEITASESIGRLLVTALQHYVDEQFPPGSADCGQVAREELLNVVTALREQLEQPGNASYSRRMRAMVKEGIRVYYDHLSRQDGDARTHECELLQEAATGVARTDEELAAARARDRAIATSQGC